MHYYLPFNEKQSFTVEYESVSHSRKQIMAIKDRSVSASQRDLKIIRKTDYM